MTKIYMKQIKQIVFIFSICFLSIETDLCAQVFGKKIFHATQFAQQQMHQLVEVLGDRVSYPRATLPNGTWNAVSLHDWTSGFFPGSLWNIYEETQDTFFLKPAKRWTENLESLQKFNRTHDIGFMIFCSYGNGYRITKNENYRRVLLQTARTLMYRYNPKVGCIKSWDKPKWSYPVIIDNMMNLELLFWASQHGGTKDMYNAAFRHAETTMKNHFRHDYSTFHLVNYDSATGNVLTKETVQGYADTSCWARGQAWAIYGFTMAYRFTKDERFLQTAERAADYFIAHLPPDFVPYWDFQVPDKFNEPRDASAAAIAASGLLEMVTVLPAGEVQEKYMLAAKQMLGSLCSPAYLAEGTKSQGILNHCVGNKPSGSEINVSLNYGDYYFLEALSRYKKYFNEAINVASPERKRVLDAACMVLNENPLTITEFPASQSAGGIHDYYSEGDYWWPNQQDSQAPYIQRDGMTNPDNFVKHREALFHFAKTVSTLTAAYRLTGEEQYAREAIKHVRSWFVTSSTRMNPSLLYAQAIRNKVTGRGIGIIDAIPLIEVARSIEILDGSVSMDAPTKVALLQWFKEYLTWLTHHQYGVDERDAKNNHGTWWVAQVAQIAHLVGDSARMDNCRDRFKNVLLPEQMAQDGSFPLELKRTKPYSYSIFNLEGFAAICKILSTPCDNLWNYATTDGRSMHKAMEFLYPFVFNKSLWSYSKDVMHFENLPVRNQMWLFAGLEFQEKKYLELWNHLQPDSPDQEVQRNQPLKQPVLWIENLPAEMAQRF
jgi:hypothetical protein